MNKHGAQSSRDLVTTPILVRFFVAGGQDRGRFMMLPKKSRPQLRFVFLRAASKTTRAFSHCYTSLESFLKAKWQMMRPPMSLKTSMKLVHQRWTGSDRLKHATTSIHIYEIRPRADHHGVDLISDALPYSPLWYRGPTQSGMLLASQSLAVDRMML
jgi:hypothetical protein